MIVIDDLRVSYGRTEAVRGLSLHIGRGLLFGLVGPNGAGKSSTLRCLVGLQQPQGGRLELDGLDPRREPAAVQRRVGYVPQALALYPSLSVLENLRIFAGLHGLRGSRLAARVDWGLELARLESQRRTRVEALSGGMARRLNLACSLLHEPALVICDEATAGVDAQSRAHIFATLRALHAAGATIVYTTHYMEEVEALCSRVAIVDEGRVVIEGTLAALREAQGASHDEYRVVVRGLQGGAAELHTRLAAAGLAVERVERPPRSLEDVFLETTGHRLRDDDEEAG